MISEFEDLLKRTMGLDATSVGPASIERAVRRRMVACESEGFEEYWKLISGSASELLELIEAVIVPETWFFRDVESFSALGKLVLEDWLPTHPQGQLRLLSIPCCTGEEPCSIAMTLLSLALPPERFQVDAVDISPRSLLLAECALYGKNSFRGNDLNFRDRYFAETAQGYRLSPEVRRRVNYQSGNLLAGDFFPGAGLYDIIFCRNLLIYFDRPTQDLAIKILDRLLTEKGWLFIGPAETGLLLKHRFISIKLPLAFAFRKGETHPPAVLVKPAPRQAKKRPMAPVATAARSTISGAKVRPGIISTTPASEPTPRTATNLDAAARLADKGQLRDAAHICETYLRSHPDSARAYYLLGVVRDAAGEGIAAAEFYQKALFLEPNHYEAMMHLAYAAEKRGDTTTEKKLRERAQRVRQRVKHA